jgi:hypothetical protein
MARKDCAGSPISSCDALIDRCETGAARVRGRRIVAVSNVPGCELDGECTLACARLISLRHPWLRSNRASSLVPSLARSSATTLAAY